MSDDDQDPAASTQMFQAFMDREREPEPSVPGWVWAAVAVVTLLVVAALAWFLLG
jgi:hypothetical protein